MTQPQGDVLIDGTLFKASFQMERLHYLVASYTPVEGYPKPLSLNTRIREEDAREFMMEHPAGDHSVDSAALHLGIEKLQPQIPHALRQLRLGEIVEQELEEIEGYGSF